MRKFKLKFISILAVGFVLLSSFLIPKGVNAATYTWDGGGGDNNWTTCANWTSDTCPLSTDSVTFSGVSTKNVSIDTSVTVADFSILTGYTGVITPSGANTITINASFNQQAGTFNASAATTTVSGYFTFSGGTFNHNNGVFLFSMFGNGLVYTPNSAVFNNVEFRGEQALNYDTYLASDMIISRNLVVQHTGNTYDRTIRSNSSSIERTIFIGGDFTMPSNAASGGMQFGYSPGTYPIKIDLKGNYNQFDAQGNLFGDVVFSSSSTQTITRTAGFLYNTSDWFDTGAGNLALTANFVGSMRLITDATDDFNFVPSPYTFTAGSVSITAGTSFTPEGPSTYNITSVSLSTGTLNVSTSTLISNFNQSGGVFNASVATTTFNGTFTYSAGTFNHNGGTVRLTSAYSMDHSPGSAVFNNLMMEGTGSTNFNVGLASNVNVERDFIVQNSASSFDFTIRSSTSPDERTISVGGNFIMASTPLVSSNLQFGYSPGTYPIKVDLKGDYYQLDAQANFHTDIVFSSSSTQTLYKTGGTIGAQSDWYDTGAGNLALTSNLSGSMRLNTDSTDDFNFVPSAYTFGAEGFVIAPGTTFAPVGPSSYSFTTFNLTQGTFIASSTTLIANFNQSGGTFVATNATTTVTGNFTFTGGTFDANGGTLRLAATYGRTFSFGAAALNNLLLEGTGGGNYTNLIASDINVGGNLIVVNYNNSFDSSYNSNLIGTLRTINVAGDLIFPNSGTSGPISWGYFNGSSYPMVVNLSGNLRLEDSNVVYFDDLNFVGSGTQTINYTAGNVYNTTLWTINKPSGIASLISSITHSGAVNVATGTLKIGGNSLSPTGGLAIGDAGILDLTGNETITTPTLASSSTIIYSGTSGPYTMRNFSYRNLTIRGAGGTFNLPAALTVGGNLNIASGTLDVTASNFGLNVAGNWSKAGTFNPRTGTTTLNGINQTVTGTNTFYNLSKTVASPATLSFGAGQTQTVTGRWSANGAAGNLLSLRSTVDGSQWNIDPQGARSLSYTDVKDSNNINASSVVTNGTMVSSGNNINWGFDGTPPVTSAIVVTPGANSANVTWLTNESATSTLYYGQTTSYGSSSTSLATSSHSVNLTGLISNVLYHYIIVATDPLGNVSTTSDATFTTLDNIPPVISSIATSTTPTSASITWDTDESTNSKIVYGTSLSFGSTAISGGTVSHLANLTGLTPDTTYYFEVVATDTSGNISTTTNQSLKTQVAPPVANTVQPGMQSAVSGFTSAAELEKIFGKSIVNTPLAPTTVPQVSSGSTIIIKNDVAPGGTTNEVRIIQRILNADTVTQIAKSGVGSPGKETNYFGPATKIAIQKFQLKYKVVTSAKDSGYGRVGPKTRAMLNSVAITKGIK